jgi:hypothetical protein
MWREMPFCHQAAFVRTSWMKACKFDLRYKLAADFDFLYKSYLSGKKFFFVNKVICLFDYRQGASKNNRLRSITERRDVSLKHRFNIYRWLYFFTYVGYVKLVSSIKNIIGDKTTAWITRLLRT